MKRVDQILRSSDFALSVHPYQMLPPLSKNNIYILILSLKVTLNNDGEKITNTSNLPIIKG